MKLPGEFGELLLLLPCADPATGRDLQGFEHPPPRQGQESDCDPSAYAAAGGRPQLAEPRKASGTRKVRKIIGFLTLNSGGLLPGMTEGSSRGDVSTTAALNTLERSCVTFA